MLSSMDAPRDEEGKIVMTKEYLRYICEREGQYSTPRLNNQLYLNNKGFAAISCLEPYVEVEALWLQNNCLEKIEDISTLKKLKFLYLQNNVIERIGNLEPFSELVRLDLSDNRIAKVEGLSGLVKLKDLKMQNNSLASAESLKGLLDVAGSLEYLDLTGNKIKSDPELIPLLKQLTKLTSLSLKDNPAIHEIANYRKTLVAALPGLGYLDGNMIEEIERLSAEAFAKGGKPEEREARKKYHDEQEALRQHKIEGEREYYKKVEERMKKTLVMIKEECIDRYKKLMARREELLKRIFAAISCRHRRRKGRQEEEHAEDYQDREGPPLPS